MQYLYNEYSSQYKTYKGYELTDTVESWELTNKQKETFDIAHFIVDNKVSIRAASREFMIAKSTLHDRLKRDLPKISYELYQVLCRQLKLNKQKYFK